jgi:hypothetical protein
LSLISSSGRQLSPLFSFNGTKSSSSSSWTGSQVCQLQQLSSNSLRTSVIAAARGRKTDQQQPPNPNSAEALQKLTLAQLRARCEQEGLSSNGKKADLAVRLAQHLQESDGSSQEAAADAAADLAPADADAAAGEDVEDADISFEELLVELQAELQTYTEPELVKCLQDRGLSTTGAKKDLVERLAVAVAEE